MTVHAVEPQDMEWHDKGVLGIRWSDGHQGIYPVRYLRQHCPCAACVDEWTGARRLIPEDIPLLIMLQDIQPVAVMHSNLSGVTAMIREFILMIC